ncbi:unnamed protein product [Dibothriocephalus latus]|uniref:Uncharacterized protein n=1 Tax=Dibothriocephalus latus TaxID=60516 RepID=A0A3P7NT06_DIBLA|nr:unnamed protein product [Dibothriocephalus latus]
MSLLIRGSVYIPIVWLLEPLTLSRGVFVLIPTLMNFLFECVYRDREKAYALVTLGLMAQSLGADFETGGYLSQLFAILTTLITPSKEAASK